MKTADERTADIIAGESQARADRNVVRLQEIVLGGVVAARKLEVLGEPPIAEEKEASMRDQAEQAAARAAEEAAAKTAENEAAAAVLAAAATPADTDVDPDAT